MAVLGGTVFGAFQPALADHDDWREHRHYRNNSWNNGYHNYYGGAVYPNGVQMYPGNYYGNGYNNGYYGNGYNNGYYNNGYSNNIGRQILNRLF